MKNKVLSAFNKSASKLSKNGFVQAAVIVLILISCIISTAAFSTNCKEVRDNVLRLHILANSDSEEDQALKLKIRDKLLTEGADIFAGAEDADSAAEKIAAAAERLETLAEDTAREMGYSYDIKVELPEEYFDVRR